MYDLIIIGGGPAGLTAAIYAAREKLKTLLITKEFGGQMAKKDVEIENFPGFESIAARELIERLERQVKKLNVEIKTGTADGIAVLDGGFVVNVRENAFEAKAIIVATGADPRFLNVPGEKEFIGRGVGYCTTCDGPLFAGRNVAVVGGGNSAFESALFLTKFARKVYILEYSSKVRASAELQERVLGTGKAEILTGAKVLEVIGEKFVKGVKYLEVSSGKEITLPVDGVFIKVGHAPASALARELADVNDMDEIKFHVKTHQTRTPGLFVAGDVSEEKYKQIIIACGEGAKAALSASEYLESRG